MDETVRDAFAMPIEDVVREIDQILDDHQWLALEYGYPHLTALPPRQRAMLNLLRRMVEEHPGHSPSDPEAGEDEETHYHFAA